MNLWGVVLLFLWKKLHICCYCPFLLETKGSSLQLLSKVELVVIMCIFKKRIFIGHWSSIRKVICFPHFLVTCGYIPQCCLLFRVSQCRVKVATLILCPSFTSGTRFMRSQRVHLFSGRKL